MLTFAIRVPDGAHQSLLVTGKVQLSTAPAIGHKVRLLFRVGRDTRLADCAIIDVVWYGDANIDALDGELVVKY